METVQAGGDEDGVAAQLRFVMDLVNRCVASRGAILGNYAELPAQPKAPEKGKVEVPAYLNAIISEGTLEQVGDIEALPLARPLVGGGEQAPKPPSAKGAKKGAEAVPDAAAMPTAPLY